MSNVLHDPRRRAKMNLQKAFESMVNRGLLIIQDFFFDESKTGPVSVALFNLMAGAYSISKISSVVREVVFINVRELKILHRTHSIVLAENTSPFDRLNPYNAYILG